MAKNVFKRLIKLFSINLFIVLILLKIVDYMLPNKIIGSNSLNTNRSILLKEYKPNITYKDDNINIPGLKVSSIFLKTDSDGFIMDSNEYDSKKKQVDIIFYGGSVTECLYMNQNKRFPSQVGSLLSNELKKEIISINGGGSGNHSYHSTLSFLAKGVNKKPKIVFLLNVFNDLSLLAKTGSYWDAPPQRRIIQIKNQNGLFYRSLKFLKDLYPNIYYSLKNFLQFNPNQVFDEFKNFRRKSFLAKQEDLSHIKKEFKKSILNFISVARNNEIIPVLITQFHNYDKNIDSLFVKNTFVFNQIIKSTASQQKINYIDLHDSIPKSVEYIYDGSHLTEKGSDLASKIISNFTLNNFKETLLN